MCPLYLATCLSSPPLILAGGAGLPERGGGSVHLDPGLTSGRMETEGSGWGDSPLVCPQWEEPGFVALFRCCWARRGGGEWGEDSGRGGRWCPGFSHEGLGRSVWLNV